jgi:hypothetical protein
VRSKGPLLRGLPEGPGVEAAATAPQGGHCRGHRAGHNPLLDRGTGRGWGTVPQPRRRWVGSTGGGQRRRLDRGMGTAALWWRKRQVWWQ